MVAVPPLNVTVDELPSPKSMFTVPFGVPLDAVPVTVVVKETDCPAMLGFGVV